VRFWLTYFHLRVEALVLTPRFAKSGQLRTGKVPVPAPWSSSGMGQPSSAGCQTTSIHRGSESLVRQERPHCHKGVAPQHTLGHEGAWREVDCPTCRQYDIVRTEEQGEGSLKVLFLECWREFPCAGSWSMG